MLDDAGVYSSVLLVILTAVVASAFDKFFSSDVLQTLGHLFCFVALLVQMDTVP